MLFFISDGNNTITNIKSVEIDDKEYISFDVTSVTSVTDGNSVLIADDWSWHLWFCDPDHRPEESLHEYPSKARVLNRALGATSYTGYETVDIPPIEGITNGGTLSLSFWKDGLYYQWGNKNPFISSQYVGVGHTTSDSWDSDDKTKTDPCPPGYKVPSINIWQELSSTNGVNMERILANIEKNAFPYNVVLDAETSKNIVYPYGYRYNQEIKEYEYNNNIQNSTKDASRSSNGFTIKVTVKYNGNDYKRVGKIWACDGEFSYYKSGKTVTSSTVSLTVSYSKHSFSVNNINMDEENALSNAVKTYTESNIISKLPFGKATVRDALNKALNAINIDQVGLDLLSSLTSLSLEGKPSTTISESIGCHVRCVVDN